MQFPGTNKLQLSEAALCAALEGAINSTRRDGEDYVYVTDVDRKGYGYGEWLVTVTTDKPASPDVRLVQPDDVALEAA